MWNKSWLNCSHTEHAFMSCFCTPCLFGMNKAKLETLNGVPNASMIPGCFTYSMINIGWQVIGMMYSTAISSLLGVPPVAEMMQITASLCGAMGTGMYASQTRKEIREKYNIDGSLRDDILMHTLLPQCAVCQEANEIEYQQTVTVNFTEVNNNCYVSVPEFEPMIKDT